ncbi:MAG: hypothetical protein RLZ13_407 [Bacteroidota bacterium]|jgi:hypothetical protein
MAEFKSAPTTETKKATASPKQEGKIESSELEYADNRSSTAQLVSLQSAADDKGNRSNTTQLQAKASVFTGLSRIAQLKAASDLRQPAANDAPVQRQENKTGLPDKLKSGMESLSGLSMSDVKVHRNSDKPAQLHAHAYAQGTDIHLGPGQEKHLPHELGHVVQQKEGRVQPTTQLQSKVNINDDAGLEKEADVLGAKAMQFKAMPNFQAAQTTSTSSTFSSNTFQLAPINPAPEKIDRRGDDGKGNANETIEQQGLDHDLWFKASEGIEDVTATTKTLPLYVGPIPSAFHVTTNDRAAESILNRVDPRFHNPLSRFGGGFYVATDLNTAYAEVQAHEFDNIKKGKPEDGLLTAVHLIEYTGVATASLVDASSKGFFGLDSMVQKEPKKIEKKAREDARDGIIFNSTKGKGKNIVLFKNYGVLKPKGHYTNTADGFQKFKEENPLKKEEQAKIDKAIAQNNMENGLSNENIYPAK